MPKQLFNLFTPVRKVFKRDYHGNLYETTVMGNPDIDYAKLWAEFIERNNQPTVDTTGQHQSIGNKLSEYGERVLREREGEV